MSLYLVCWWLTLYGTGAEIVTMVCGCGCNERYGYGLVYRGVLIGIT